jgi:hypothetical protein
MKPAFLKNELKVDIDEAGEASGMACCLTTTTNSNATSATSANTDRAGLMEAERTFGSAS